LAALLLLAAAGCTPKPAIRPTAEPAAKVIAPGTRVLLLTPLVRFESMQSEAALDDIAYDETAYAARLHDAARAAAAGAGAAIIECGLPQAHAATTAACGELAPHTLALSRGIVRPDAAVALARVAAETLGVLVLATACLGRLGPGGYYNANSGQIKAASASTVLSAALLGADGRAVWKNDVLLRAIPEATDESYREALELLFTAAPRP